MKTVIVDVPDYKVTARITPVPTNPDLFEFMLTSTLATAKNPNEDRRISQVFLTRGSLQDLSALIASVA